MEDRLASLGILERNTGLFQIPVKPLDSWNALENEIIVLRLVGFEFSQRRRQFGQQAHVRRFAVLGCRSPDLYERCYRIQMQIAQLERREFPSPQARMDGHQVNRLPLTSPRQQSQ